MTVSFKAQYIMPVNIKKKNQSGYNETKADFYKLNPSQMQDIRLVKQLADSWGDDSYAINLYGDLKSERKNFKKNQKNIYVLTNPTKNISAKDVLGIVSVNRKPKNFNDVDFLQVNPKYLNSRTYKKIGERIMDCVKILHMEKPLHVIADENVTGFYEKIGFEKINEGGLDYIWYA